MQIQALTKYVRMSPKKIREVTREIQGRPADEALELLSFIPRKSARLIRKTLKSAIANAENNNNIPSDSLIVETAVAEEAPVIKRWRAGARGMAKPIQKRNSHIRIVLTEVAPDESE
jgi:large subunit ribosomal protein L22